MFADKQQFEISYLYIDLVVNTGLENKMCKWSNQSENVFLKEKTMIIKNPKIWPFPNSKSSVARNRKAIASRTIVSKNANADVEKGK